jgi:hypothetical protein
MISARSILLFLTLLVLTGCWENFHLTSNQKIRNNTGRLIYAYPKITYPDTLLNKEDSQLIFQTLKRGDEDISPFLNPVKPHSWNYIGTYGYGDSSTWKKTLKHDTLILYILDKNTLITTQSTDQAKLKMYLLNYKSMKPSDTIIFDGK